MRIISCNVNGIRSAHKKGFFEWSKGQNPDFICVQETKAQIKKLKLELKLELKHDLGNYHHYESPAEKPGYSGVAVYAKTKPLDIKHLLGFPCADKEGRFIQLVYEDFSIVSIYFPSGASGERRQAEKYHFLAESTAFFENIIHRQKSFIICGDFNIAHKIIDIKNWRANQKHAGFLPEERLWMDKLFKESNWTDAFRVLNQESGQYTWWSNRGKAYEKNVGWRIDYQIVTPDWKDKIKRVEIYTEKRFSDHAPLIIDYQL